MHGDAGDPAMKISQYAVLWWCSAAHEKPGGNTFSAHACILQHTLQKFPPHNFDRPLKPTDKLKLTIQSMDVFELKGGLLVPATIKSHSLKYGKSHTPKNIVLCVLALKAVIA